MRHIVLAMTVVVLASACGAPSAEDLAKNPQQFARVMEDCLPQIAAGADLSEKCRNAVKASEIMTRNAIKGILN